MNEDDRNIRNIDPDYFDLLVTALSGLSSVAQLATSWREFRKNDRRQKNEAQQTYIREQLRQIQRSFDDVFHNVREAVRILERAHSEATDGSPIDKEKRGWGTRLMLNQQELQQLMGPLSGISGAINSLKVHVLGLEMNLSNSSVEGEANIDFQIASFNDGLNEALFESQNLGEMRDRIYILERRADDFLRHARRMLEPN